MNAHAAGSPSKMRRAGLLALLAVLVVTLFPAPPAEAYYNEGSQSPGTVQRNQGGGGAPGGQRRCGSATNPNGTGPILWRREANGVWRVEAINYPTCTGTIGVVTNTGDNTTGTFNVNDPDTTWGNSGDHLYWQNSQFGK